MATVARENLGTLHDIIKVTVMKGEYLPAFEKSLKQYAKTANIPGFRKGMVPAPMVKKMAGQHLFNEEIIKTAQRKLEIYMREQRLVIFGQPMLIPDPNMAQFNMNYPVDVEFSYEIGIKPEFDIPAIRNRAPLTAYKIKVTTDIVNAELAQLRKRFGTIDDDDTVTQPDNVIFCTLEACDADGNVTVPNTTEETALVDTFPGPLKGQLMGAIAGTVVVFQPTAVCTEMELPRFLHDFLKTNVEEAASHYLLTVKKVGMLIPAEVGMELYEKVFPNTMITGETDFREKLEMEIQREYDRIGRERYHNEIFELLVHNTPIMLPITFLKRWLKEGGEKPKTELEVEAEFSQFEHQLRWQLISDKLIHEAGIKVTRDEVIGDIRKRVLAYYGMDEDEDAPWLGPYMDKVSREQKTLDETYGRMMAERLFAILENQFTTEVKEVDMETFAQLPNPHAQHHHHH